MTPQDKAKDLVVTYKNILPTMNYQVLDETAKQCALIAVEEIIDSPYVGISDNEWWQQVKEDIEKL